MDESRQSRMPTIIAVGALAVAIYNGLRINEAETAAEYVNNDLQDRIVRQAEEIELLAKELERSQNALLTMGETIKSTNRLIDVLRDKGNADR